MWAPYLCDLSKAGISRGYNPMCAGPWVRRSFYLHPSYGLSCAWKRSFRSCTHRSINYKSSPREIFTFLAVAYFKRHGRLPFIPMPIFSHAAAISSNLSGILVTSKTGSILTGTLNSRLKHYADQDVILDFLLSYRVLGKQANFTNFWLDTEKKTIKSISREIQLWL